MKTYELTYIISPAITSEEALAKAKEIESAIQTKDGVINSHTNPSAKPLSYPIKGSASGFFGILEFQLEPEKMPSVADILTKDKKIVRHLITTKEKARIRKERKPKSLLQEKPAIEPTGLEATSQSEASLAPSEQESASKKKTTKEKVELKDIEHELDEILG